MAFMIRAAEVFRDFVTWGVPSSGKWQPKKSDLRAWGAWLEENITAFFSTGGKIYQTQAILVADLSPAANSIAWVMEDPTVANNGIYRKVGGAGAGSWVRAGDLPFSFIVASSPGAGTGNAIDATTSIPVSSSALVILPIAATNTASPVTVSFNGGSALTIKTNSGIDVDVGGLLAGAVALGVISGETFRLLSDQAVAQSLFAARDEAVVARNEAVEAAENAVAQGNVPIFVSRDTAAAFALSAFSIVQINRWSSSSLVAPANYAKVAIEPAHAAKFQDSAGNWFGLSDDVIDIRSLGAMCDGIVDDTAAVVLAGSQPFAGKEVRFPSKAIVVKGTLPVYSKFVGIAGTPTFKLTVNGGSDQNSHRGFWMKSNSSMHNFIIERGVSGGSISGDFNNGAVVGDYYSLGQDYSNIHMSSIHFIGVDAGVGRRSIFGVYGNSHDCTFKNFRFSGFISYAFMNHWGGTFDPSAPDTSAVTAAWRPRRILIDGVFMENPMPDAALGCIYLSGVHDYTVRNVFTNGVRTPIVVAAGDIGGLLENGDSLGQTLKNIRFENCTLINYQVAGVLMSGLSGTRGGSLWIANNEGALVTFDNLVIRRGSLSTSARAIDARFMTGLRMKGVNITHLGDGFQDIFTPAIFLQACDDTEISGCTKVPFATELVGCGKGVKVDTADICLRGDYNTSCYGTRLTGQSGGHVLDTALAVGDQSVTLQSLAFDLVAGSTITIGGRTMVLTKAAAQSASSVVLSITKSFVAAVAGAAATVEKYTGNVELSGYCEGFYIGVLLANTSSGKARGVTVRNRRFKRTGLHEIYGRAAKGLSVLDCLFEEGGQLDTSATNSIRLIDGCSDIKIIGNTFEGNEDNSTLIRSAIYLFGDATGVMLSGNRFHNSQLSAINKFAPAVTATEDHDISGNWFGPLLPAGATGRISGTSGYYSTTIGDRRVGYASGAPTTGSWRTGDVIYSTGAAAGGKAGWICTTGGAPGAWKPFGAIDA